MDPRLQSFTPSSTPPLLSRSSSPELKVGSYQSLLDHDVSLEPRSNSHLSASGEIHANSGKGMDTRSLESSVKPSQEFSVANASQLKTESKTPLEYVKEDIQKSAELLVDNANDPKMFQAYLDQFSAKCLVLPNFSDELPASFNFKNFLNDALNDALFEKSPQLLNSTKLQINARINDLDEEFIKMKIQKKSNLDTLKTDYTLNSDQLKEVGRGMMGTVVRMNISDSKGKLNTVVFKEVSEHCPEKAYDPESDLAHVSLIGVPRGENARFIERNVASFQLAKKLDVKSLIVETKEATLNGKKGIQMEDLGAQGDIRSVDNAFYSATVKIFRNADLIRDYYSIRALNALCGQFDQGISDILMIEKDGQFQRLVAIDQDLSFPPIDFPMVYDSSRNKSDDLYLHEWKGIPKKIDKRLAENILKLRPAALHEIARDRLTDAEQTAFKKRVLIFQQEIKKAQRGNSDAATCIVEDWLKPEHLDDAKKIYNNKL
jgi:hypothetical protein